MKTRAVLAVSFRTFQSCHRIRRKLKNPKLKKGKTSAPKETHVGRMRQLRSCADTLNYITHTHRHRPRHNACSSSYAWRRKFAESKHLKCMGRYPSSLNLEIPRSWSLMPWSQQSEWGRFSCGFLTVTVHSFSPAFFGTNESSRLKPKGETDR